MGFFSKKVKALDEVVVAVNTESGLIDGVDVSDNVIKEFGTREDVIYSITAVEKLVSLAKTEIERKDSMMSNLIKEREMAYEKLEEAEDKHRSEVTELNFELNKLRAELDEANKIIAENKKNREDAAPKIEIMSSIGINCDYTVANGMDLLSKIGMSRESEINEEGSRVVYSYSAVKGLLNIVNGYVDAIHNVYSDLLKNKPKSEDTSNTEVVKDFDPGVMDIGVEYGLLLKIQENSVKPKEGVKLLVPLEDVESFIKKFNGYIKENYPVIEKGFAHVKTYTHEDGYNAYRMIDLKDNKNYIYRRSTIEDIINDANISFGVNNESYNKLKKDTNEIMDDLKSKLAEKAGCKCECDCEDKEDVLKPREITVEATYSRAHDFTQESVDSRLICADGSYLYSNLSKGELMEVKEFVEWCRKEIVRIAKSRQFENTDEPLGLTLTFTKRMEGIKPDHEVELDG